MTLKIDLLRSSFHAVLEREPNLTHLFYDELFARYPQAKPLFGKNARRGQEEMLARALVSVVDHLDDAPWLAEQLGALGAKHLGYGVLPEMYGWVGESLLATLAKAAGELWSDELAAAWGEAYGAIVGLMRAGEAVAAE